MLSPLQERVARTIAGLDQAEGFALAGGAALILRGIVDRRTRDLDFFGLNAEAVARLLPAVESALVSGGLRVDRVIDHAGFARLIVSDGDDETELDLGSDARLFPVEQAWGIPLLSLDELAVDKVLAVFGRAEARDFVDLLAVLEDNDLPKLLRLAAEKDRGFDPTIFAGMLARFDRLPREAFSLDDARLEELKIAIGRWRELTLEYGRGHTRGLAP